ncbi:MAG: SH3 domain-containing protein [Anaerolineaceae bacterium]
MKKQFISITTVIVCLLLLQLACGLSSPTPLPATPTLQPPAPTDTPQPTPTLTLLPALPTTEPPRHRQYSVALRKPGETANIRSAPGETNPVIGSLSTAFGPVYGTGSLATVNNQQWIEITFSGSKTGWVSGLYLTEAVSSGAFCADSRVAELLTQLKTVLWDQDGELFASLVSPTRGLTVRLLTGGNWASYTPEQVSWLLRSSYQFNWGKAPGSGLDVVGSFPQKIEQPLTEVVNSDYQTACNQVLVGGASYPAVWPDFYAAFNYVSLYRPGAAGDELNWRTWLVGFEYVNGQPYIMTLVTYAWEP